MNRLKEVLASNTSILVQMDLADLPSESMFAKLHSELLQDVLFRAVRGATADRVAELLSVCKLFRCEIKKCSGSHATHARPDANQPLKLQDCAALKSLVVEERRVSLINQHFLLSGTAVAPKAMQHILESPNSKISVLATVSPAASSTEETLAVLGALASVAPVHVLKRQPQLRSSPPPFPTPEQENVSPKTKIYPRDELSLLRQWNRDELMEWMARKHLLGDQLPYDIDGRKAMRMTIGQLQETFYGEADRKKADRLHQALRAENDRVARMRVKARMAQERERMSAIQVC